MIESMSGLKWFMTDDFMIGKKIEMYYIEILLCIEP